MHTNKRITNPGKVLGLLAVFSFGLLFEPSLRADVVILQSGAVITGKVLQQDASGVLLQMAYGTYRYQAAWIRDVKKDATAAPTAASNGQRIPDWAEIVTLLANNSWAQGMKQVPATVINSGRWANVPYISFRCASGGYEVNIYGDLNNPAAVQIGAMNDLSQSALARTNCVNFICSVLGNADDVTIVRALNLNQKDVEKKGGMVFETIQPGEPSSYGGWWVTVYNDAELANSHASESELLSLAQPVAATAQSAAATTGVAAQSGGAAPQTTTTVTQMVASTTGSAPIETYGATPAWSAEELAAARPATPVTPAAYPTATGDKPATAVPAASDKVYPRTYDRAGGSYGARR